MDNINSLYNSIINQFDLFSEKDGDISCLCFQTLHWLDKAKPHSEKCTEIDGFATRIYNKLLSLPDDEVTKKTQRIFFGFLSENKKHIKFDYSNEKLLEELKGKDPKNYESMIKKDADGITTLELIGGDILYEIILPTELKDEIDFPEVVLYHYIRQSDRKTIMKILGPSPFGRVIRRSKLSLIDVLLEKGLKPKPIAYERAIYSGNLDIFEKFIMAFKMDETTSVNFTDFWKRAVFLHKIELIKPLINSGFILQQKNVSLTSLLEHAAKYGNRKAINYFLNHGVEANTGTLSSICSKGYIDLAKILINSKVAINPDKDLENIPLFSAIESQSEEMFYLIVNSQADLTIKNNDKDTALHSAVKCKNLNAIKFLMHKLDINAENKFCRTPLEEAVKEQDFEIVELLLKNGADVNHYGGSYSQTPLSYATKTGNKDLISLLIEKGALINPSDPKVEHPLYTALYSHQFSSFDFLIKLGADIAHVDNEGKTLLHKMTYFKIEFAKKYIHNFDVNKQDNNGFTPLNLACLFGYVEFADLLLKHGAKTNIPNFLGQLPLHSAAGTTKTTFDFFNKLTEKTKNINSRDKNGYTPLHLCIQHSPHNIKTLLKHGADTTIKINFEVSCYELANEYSKQVSGNYSMFIHKMLYDYGCIPSAEELKANKGFTYLYLDLKQRGKLVEANELDEKLGGLLSENEQRLKLAHRFAIIGEGKDGFDYEGFWPDFTYRELIHSFQNFAKINDIGLTESEICEFVEAFEAIQTNLDEEKLYERYQKKKMVIIPTGWEAHSTADVLIENELYRCNKGSGVTEYAISHFTISDLPKEYISSSIYSLGHVCRYPKRTVIDIYKQKELFKKHFTHSIDTPDKKESFKAKNAKTGNCTWGSAKLALRAALYISLKRKYPEKSPENLKKDVTRIYKKWRICDLAVNITAYLQSHEDSGEISPKTDVKLLELILKKCEDSSEKHKYDYKIHAEQIRSFLKYPLR